VPKPDVGPDAVGSDVNESEMVAEVLAEGCGCESADALILRRDKRDGLEKEKEKFSNDGAVTAAASSFVDIGKGLVVGQSQNVRASIPNLA
jgi:hypothetical protein